MCDDGLFCTINDMCKGGTCIGTPNPCPSAGGCYTGTCDMTLQMCTMPMKVADGTPCNDGDVCNTDKQCTSGVCSGGTPANNGMMCTPTMPCSVGTCNNGMCTGGTAPTFYFQEEFNDNSKGWTMDPEWQIGPAKASSCQTAGNPDPAMDMPMTPANGIAGVVIGGCEDKSMAYPPRYLTSPPFDTSMATGSVIVGFYRWLNSDTTPRMNNYIEVFDGTTWHSLWTSNTTSITDMSWTYVSFDVTAYKNAKMQVRFGFDVNKGVALVSSWNVDDVLVANAECP
jgi:hypothetical protein